MTKVAADSTTITVSPNMIPAEQRARPVKRQPVDKDRPKRKAPRKPRANTVRNLPKGMKKVSIKQLKDYKKYLNAVSSVENKDNQLELMKRMSKKDLEFMCDCMQNFLRNEEVSHRYFNQDELEHARNLIRPWARKLKTFTDPNVHYHRKRRMLSSKQKGGSVILASVIGSLLPMAVQAISKLIWPRAKQ